MPNEKLYRGISKIAWGYIFILFDFNLNTVSILPDFVGFLMILSAIDILKEEERELSLLRSFGIVLAVGDGMDWLLSWFAIDMDGLLIVGILVSLIAIYFHFQLLTNVASIASRYQPLDVDLASKFLMYRNAQAVLYTVTTIFGYLKRWTEDIGVYEPMIDWLGDVVIWIFLILSFIYVIVEIGMILDLFGLRKLFRGPVI